ncbi:MAG: hypothetical protein LBH35_05750, partial [Treponema sp.]|nr:hypothetical protein [Treponema sp.]
VLTGADNWEESLAESKMPHEQIPNPDWSKASDKTAAEWQAENGVAELGEAEKEEAIKDMIARALGSPLAVADRGTVSGNRAASNGNGTVSNGNGGTSKGNGGASPNGNGGASNGNGGAAPAAPNETGAPSTPPPQYKRWKPE